METSQLTHANLGVRALRVAHQYPAWCGGSSLAGAPHPQLDECPFHIRLAEAMALRRAITMLNGISDRTADPRGSPVAVAHALAGDDPSVSALGNTAAVRDVLSVDARKPFSTTKQPLRVLEADYAPRSPHRRLERCGDATKLPLSTP